jgi:benzoyl-CoA-dihydrodiol lyase
VSLRWDEGTRLGTLTIRGPEAADTALAARGGEALREAGCDVWALRAYRELDDVLLHLRFRLGSVGLVCVHTEGDPAESLAHDAALLAASEHWFAREIVLHMASVLRRLDNTSHSFFAVGGRGSAFAGSLLDLALAADRFYALDAEKPVQVGLGALGRGELPMQNGRSRIEARLWGEPERLATLLGRSGLMGAAEAEEAGLVTILVDEIDWDDDTRVAIEERLSLSPDALTGMEQNLRFVGPEGMHGKIYGRLSTWQNWIFVRPNATGPRGALSLYGRPESPRFEWERV